MKIEKVLEFYHPTSDEWYPNFPNNTVRISLCAYYNGTNMIRLAVWGADDFGMEKDFHLRSSKYELKIKSLKKWLRDSLQNPVTIKWLEEQGFVRA